MRLFSKSDKTITISTVTIAKSIALAIAAVLLLQFTSSVLHQLTLILVAAFLALALNPVVSWLTKHLKSGSRTRATGLAYISVMVVLIGFLSTVVPPLVRQTNEFIRNVPSTIDEFKTRDSAVARTVRRYELDKQLDDLSRDFSTRIDELTGPVITTAGRAIGTLVSIITVLVLTFMMLIEGPLWYSKLLNLYDPDKRRHRDEIAKKMYKVVTGYVNGQVLIAAIAAAFALIAMLIASTTINASINAVALAGIVFLFGLIPLIGNILAAALVVLFSLFASTTLAIVMAIYFLLYQQIENVTLQPYIQSRSNQLTPLTVFIAAILGVGFGGLLGALAAIPTAGCIRILVDDFLSHKQTP